GADKCASRKATISSGSARRPSPERPLASSPSPGGMMWLPKVCKHSKLERVLPCCHISRSMAGATKTGDFAERYTAQRRLSHSPCANLANVLALAGATTIISAAKARCTWLFHSPELG